MTAKATINIGGPLSPEAKACLLTNFAADFDDADPTESAFSHECDGLIMRLKSAPPTDANGRAILAWLTDTARRIFRTANRYVEIRACLEYDSTGLGAIHSYTKSFTEDDYTRLTRERDTGVFVRRAADLPVETLCELVNFVQDALWRDDESEWDADMTDDIARKFQAFGLHEKKPTSKEFALLRKLWTAVQDKELAGEIDGTLCDEIADVLGE